MGVNTKDIDRGRKAVLKEIAIVKRGEPVVKIGLQGKEGAAKHPEGDGVTVAQVGTFNEFGTRSIPERSFIRSTIDENRRSLLRLNKKLFSKISTGKMTAKEALEILGEKIQLLIKKKITDLRTPPNRPSTIARKKSSNPLIDTGHMRQSVTHKVDMTGGKKKAV